MKQVLVSRWRDAKHLRLRSRRVLVNALVLIWMGMALCAGPVLAAPANDDFSGRISVSSSTSGSNVDATTEGGEPDSLGIGGASVWWQFNAPSSGWYQIDTFGGPVDTVLYVFTGSSLGALTEVASSDDDRGGTTKSRVNVFVSTNVKIAVHGFSGQNGSISLNIASISTPPGNDNFSAQINLGTTASVSTTGNNTGATLEGPEPDSLDIGSASLWWTWKPASNGFHEIDTFGSDFDTVLYVYTGSDVDDLTEIKSNDDDHGDTSKSRVVFDASTGKTYRIAVHGFDGDEGSITLNINDVPDPPENDDFEGAEDLGKVVPVAESVDNSGASFEGFEQDSFDSGGASLWWKWKAPADATFSIDTIGSAIDTVLYVFTGPDLENLVEVAANDDLDGMTLQSRVNIAATTDEEFFIAVHGFFGENGAINLNIGGTTSPGNDNFSSPINLGTAASVDTSGTNVGATLEVGEPDPIGIGGASVWWEWQPNASGFYEINTVGSNFDTVVMVFTGASLPGLVIVDGNDDDNAVTTQSRLVFNASSAQTYKIAVHGFFGGQGTIELQIDQVGTPPVNDNFASATGLAGADVVNAAGDNTGATVELEELADDGSSVWFTWVAPTGGTTAINTFGSDFNTVLRVYTGASLGGLVEVGSNDDANGTSQSLVSFAAGGGTTYRIAVHGFEGATGAIQLQVSQLAPYPTWLALYPSMTGPDSLPLANFDDDPYWNLLELALGLDPTVNSSISGADPNAANAPVFGVTPAKLEIEYRISETNLNGGGGTPISVMGRVSTDLGAGSLVAPISLGGNLYRVETVIDATPGKFLEVTVIDSDWPLGPYPTWLALYPSMTGPDSLPLANFDSDPYSNLLELALGLDPTVNSSISGADPNVANAPVFLNSPAKLGIEFRISEKNLYGGVGTPISVMGRVSTDLGAGSLIAPVSLGGNLYKVETPMDATPGKFLEVTVIDGN